MFLDSYYCCINVDVAFYCCRCFRLSSFELLYILLASLIYGNASWSIRSSYYIDSTVLLLSYIPLLVLMIFLLEISEICVCAFRMQKVSPLTYRSQITETAPTSVFTFPQNPSNTPSSSPGAKSTFPTARSG